jgi:light-regulated signal transduction histidine kinase (bacteriophytochrome)
MGSFYFRIITPNGKEKTLLAKGIIQLNDKNEIAFILGTIQDVTEQKAIENELLQKTQALESMNANLQKFTSVASHDFQEPLRKITSFLTLLQKQYAGDLDQKGQGFIAKTVDATTRMQQLIQSILEFSKLPTQELSFAEVNLTNVLNIVLNNLEIAITEKQAIITVDKLSTIAANPGQMEQLFQNIISNSIKFTNPNQQPIIKITSEIINKATFAQEDPNAENRKGASTKNFCQITITDNGIGFEESYAEQIFLPFQRLNSKIEFEGTGIGLAICKKIVENHNGSIMVKSKVDEGSTFIIQLPVQQQ